jgi:phytochelatin synthase
MGLTLDELAGLARAKTRRSVTVLRDMNAEEFREHLKRSNDPAHRYIINFDRKMIFGAGAGHHSPIGGYLENEDLLEILRKPFETDTLREAAKVRASNRAAGTAL